MIKRMNDFKTEDMKINVKLKSGEYFQKKDVPEQPFGDFETTVSFYNRGKVRIYPMADVEYCELIPGKAE